MGPRASGMLCTVQSPTSPLSPLEFSEGESLFYIVSPRDVVVAKERDQDDHIDWLLEKKKYEVVSILISLKYCLVRNRERIKDLCSKSYVYLKQGTPSQQYLGRC